MSSKKKKEKGVGRNAPCPCGSGKKFKKCCLGKSPPTPLAEEISTKKKLIEAATGNEVVLEEKINISADALVYFPGWNDMSKLPKILHKPSIDSVHILHELIHLEKFFVEQYSIIACNDRSLHAIIDKFKNIPEDYVAHKIIKYEYNHNPIEQSWFFGKDNLTLPDEQVATNLVQYHAFCEFCPEYNDEFSSFYEDCRSQKHTAFLMVEEAIKALESMDYKDKNSYNKCADEIIKHFATNYY